MLTWEDVCALAGGGSVACRHRPAARYDRACHAWGADALDDAACLYFVEEDALGSFTFDGVGIVVAGKRSSNGRPRLVASELPHGVANCLVLSYDEAMTLYSRLGDSLELQRRILSACDELMAKAIGGCSVDELVRRLAQVMGRPVAVVDTAYQFVARSSIEEIDALVPEEDRNPSGVTADRFEMLQTTGVIADIYKTRTVRHDVVGEFSVYTAPIMMNGVQTAYLVFPSKLGSENEVLSPEILGEMKRLVEPFAVALSHSEKFFLNKATYLPYVLSLVFDQREATDVEDIRRRLRMSGYVLKPKMYVASVQTGEGVDRLERQSLADSLRRVVANSIYLIRSDEIVLLVSRGEDSEIADYELGAWEDYLRSHNAYAGISSAFFDFSDVRNRRLKEASLALEAGRLLFPERQVHLFDDLQLDVMALALSERDEAEMFCFQPLMSVISYDERHGTELCRTLREYLAHVKTPQDACRTLFIHRNTLYKRLSRIREIMGCNFEDAEVFVSIQTTFKILDVLRARGVQQHT